SDYESWDVVETGLGWTASATFGAGLGLVASEDDRVAVGLMQGLGLAGGLTLARLAPIREFEGEEMLVGSLAMGHLVWQGIGIGRLLDLEPREFAGTVMMTTSLGGIVGAVAGDRLHLDPAETWAAFSGELWGSWLGAWAGFLYADEFDSERSRTELVVGSSAVLSNVGLLSSYVAVDGFQFTPRRMGWINLFGAAGALTGAATGALIPVDNNVQKGNVVGTVLGLGTGVVVTGVLGWGDSPRPPRASSEPAKNPTRAWMPEFEQVVPSFSSVPATDPEWMPENAEGFYLGVQGRWH
ncbi:MAG: hypothetical protein AAF658_01970, partial [Myxococcota bacterium]